MKISKLILIIVLFLLTLPGIAEALSCKGEDINIGDTQEKVLAACGEPLSTEKKEVEAVKFSRRQRRMVTIEKWTYKIRFKKILTFEDSVLTRIEDEDNNDE